MNIRQLRGALRHAEELFSASGASRQAKALNDVDEVLASADDQSVGQFVAETSAILHQPQLKDLSAEQVAEQLQQAGTDQVVFSALMAELKARDFLKDKAIAVAALYTGAGDAVWASKPKALDAVRLKFEERVYLASKAALNKDVSPW